jgi:hypothetical protein
MIGRLTAAASTGLAIVLAFGSSPAFAAPITWSVVSSPDVGACHNELHAAASASAKATWAVGTAFVSSGCTSGKDVTLIEFNNGSGWKVQPSPNKGTKHDELFGVSAVSASNAWAVGTYFNGMDDQTLIEHWNGSAWTAVNSPNASPHHDELDSVSMGTTGWAVGTYFNGTADRALTEHYNGASWSVVPAADAGPASTDHNELDSVAIVPNTSPLQAWAVGYFYNGLVNQPLIERWNGKGWSVVTSPKITDSSWLSAVAVVSPTNVFAVGGQYSGGKIIHTLVEHFSGSAWAILSSPNVGTGNNHLVAVAAVSATEVLAVGRSFSGTSDRTLVERWTGSAWVVDSTGNVGALHNELEGVAHVPGGHQVGVGTYFSGTSDRSLVENCGC